MMDIHPEVSTGIVLDGIPSQNTTEVSTQLIVRDGQTIFIGGLIKCSKSESSEGVPILRDVPLLGVYSQVMSPRVLIQKRLS